MIQRSKAHRLVSYFLLLVFSISVCGCAGMSDSDTTRSQGVGVGAGAGALIGAVIGQAIGGDTGATLLGAAIGGVVGGVAGGIYGNHVAGQKAKYAKKEDWLDACIAEARKTNTTARDQIVTTKADIMRLDKAEKSTRAAYKNAKSRSIEMANEKKYADMKLASLQKDIEKLNFELGAQQEVLKTETAQTSQNKDLTVETAKLQKSIKELEAARNELASISSRMAV